MADVTTCDLCGESPANKVDVGIVLYGVAAPDAPTGSSECMDSCESCQVKAVDLLVSHVKATLSEQVPYHAAVQEHNATIEENQATLAITSQSVRAHVLAHGEGDLPEKVRVPHEAALLAVADAEDARAATLVEAQAAADKRVAAFRKSLSPKKR